MPDINNDPMYCDCCGNVSYSVAAIIQRLKEIEALSPNARLANDFPIGLIMDPRLTELK